MLALCGALVAYWIATAGGVDSPLVTHWTYLALMALGTSLVWARAAMRTWNRTPFFALAIGLTLWTTGSIVQVVGDLRGVVPPFPSISDALWLSQYPLVLFAFLAMARARLPRVPSRLAYDAVAVTSVVAAVVMAIVLPPVLDNANDLSGVAQVVNLGYSVGDALLFATTITIGLLVGRLGGFAWPLLSAAAAALAAADAFWAIAAAKHAWEPIMTSNALYPMWPIGVAAVAWLPAGARPAVVLSPADLRVLVATTLSALGSAGMLVANEWIDLPAATVVLAGIGLLAAINRAAFRLAEGVAAARSVARERVLLDQVRAGLRCDELQLHFQPLVSVPSGAAVGAEALVRWTRNGEPVSPAEFIPVVERDDDLREEVADFVLDAALRANAAWRRNGSDIGVSVNLAAGSLADPTLPGRVGRLLRKYGVPSSKLTLEVTETATVIDVVASEAVANDLVAIGVELSIDDFGTGHSSLARIARFPISEVKVDQSFVKDLGTARRPMVATTIQLAHALGLRVVGEGVEDQTALNALRGMGCDVVQGYFISRPLEADRFSEWLADAGPPDAEGQRVDALLERVLEELEMDAAFVAEFAGDREIFRAYSGDSFGATRPGGEVPLGDSYCERVATGVFPNIISDAQHDPLTRDLPATAHGGIGAYIGTPLRRDNGDLYGTLCCLSRRARPDLDGQDLARLESIAEEIRPLLDEAGLALVRRESPVERRFHIRHRIRGWDETRGSER